MTSALMKILSACAFAFTVTIAHAQQNGGAFPNASLGKTLYDDNCAVCHGLKGKGDGVFAELLEKSAKVPDITDMAKRNKGVFPFARVSNLIDGTDELKAHGSREMPIWGKEFSSTHLELNPYNTPAAFARAKIIAVTEYIYFLQGN